jgi:hypothetical protein
MKLRQNWFVFVLWIACCMAAPSLVQAQHPIGYSSLRATSQVATFAFDSLDCRVVKEKAASFFLEEPVAVTFDVLVDAQGSVKYVRSPKLDAKLTDLRRACTSALYDFAFSPVEPERGERWFKATMVFDN